MNKITNKISIFLIVFSLGYVANDILRENNLDLINVANADVAGMDYRDLRRDRDFKNAVQYIVENCVVRGIVDSDYLYRGDISC